MNSIPKFETKRLILRQVTNEDIPTYERLFNDYQVVRFLNANIPWPYPQGGVKSYLEQNIYPHLGKTIWMWVICLKEKENKMMGAIDLRLNGNPAHRGFWLGRQFWNQGFMSEAVVPVNDFAFNVVGINPLLFSNAVSNMASRRIKEKTFATFKAIIPCQFVDKTIHEAELWELSQEAWNARKLL